MTSRITHNLAGAATLACLIGGSTSAHAATQGTAAETSSGSINIVVSVAPRAQISGLTDVVLSAVNPKTSLVRAQNVCVWSNVPGKGYSITARGSGPGSTFALAYERMTAPYSVAWNDNASRNEGSLLLPGIPLRGLVSTALTPECTSGASSTASLVITIDSTSLGQMQPEKPYSGSLSLLVSPQ